MRIIQMIQSQDSPDGGTRTPLDVISDIVCHLPWLQTAWYTQAPCFEGSQSWVCPPLWALHMHSALVLNCPPPGPCWRKIWKSFMSMINLYLHPSSVWTTRHIFVSPHTQARLIRRWGGWPYDEVSGAAQLSKHVKAWWSVPTNSKL